VRVSRRGFLLSVCIVAVVAAGLGWNLMHRVDSTPVVVSPATLERWTLVTTDGTDPWVVALKPPDTLTSALYKDASRRAGRPLIAPPRPALPVVLRSEFEDGLQGVYGTDSVLRIARESGIEQTMFTPVCLAHKTSEGESGREVVYFVPFTSEAFDQVRADLVPSQPEHAGIGVYEPGALTPLLIVGASHGSFDRWWPLHFDPADCDAPLTQQ
jgi:hypothetical protein